MGPVTVLLADDHAVVRAGISNALKELPGIRIVGEVGDGLALQTILAKANPDLLLIDVTMPDFEPISAIRQIRHQYPGMKILVVSAYDDDVYVQGLLGAGVNGYHLKDQPLSDLRLAVSRVLLGEKWVSGRLLNKLLSTTIRTSPSLTSRQQEILQLLLQGMDNQSIALETSLSVKTVENHLTRLYRQLGVQSRLEAVRFVREHPDVLGESGHTPVQVPGSRASRRPTHTSSASASISQRSKSINLLLVDDNARYRGQLRRMVGKVYPQAMIFEAKNIREAMALAERYRMRLVLVDVVLGDEDGIRCTRQLKQVTPASRIILISAYPDREFHRLGLQAGATAFVDKKNLDAATLRQIIDDTIT